MFDVIVRNGLVVDGSGEKAFKGDVAVKDGLIVAVGDVSGPARREIDAGGRVIAPGFIDPHTHFDVQLLWDGAARPALEYGVTCIVPGNCSLSLAPLKAADRPKDRVNLLHPVAGPARADHDDGTTPRPGHGDHVQGDVGVPVAECVVCRPGPPGDGRRLAGE